MNLKTKDIFSCSWPWMLPASSLEYTKHHHNRRIKITFFLSSTKKSQKSTYLLILFIVVEHKKRKILNRSFAYLRYYFVIFNTCAHNEIHHGKQIFNFTISVLCSTFYGTYRKRFFGLILPLLYIYIWILFDFAWMYPTLFKTEDIDKFTKSNEIKLLLISMFQHTPSSRWLPNNGSCKNV